jgi:ABC-type transport system involved in multi-copper enzyme maturation permease subunit
MFLSLLLVTFLVALGVSALTVRLFAPSIDGILKRIITDAISTAWLKYLTFAIYVVGISKGVRVYDLERYVNPERWSSEQGGAPLMLNANRWVLEVYRTIIESLQGIAWLLLVFFVFALVAYVIVRGLELRKRSE